MIQCYTDEVHNRNPNTSGCLEIFSATLTLVSSVVVTEGITLNSKEISATGEDGLLHVNNTLNIYITYIFN